MQEDCAKRMPTAHAHLSIRGVFLYFLFSIKSARKLVVEPPMTVGLSLISASVTDAVLAHLVD